ncbi:hypothetical protein PAECIP112173_02059 [Paenibacillus sp. JJ-100]|uniref:hypothetical protein n=1 Tax=Paenibacillus sp. JJ-100 TaxID=2974896 RepID=UPI0022FF7F9F|nr:hypothetical protein [Paenibacillus sp. JJ-100]CAI6067974.1 hypothetical protein PAECIP112173_02059 [Paenibacillus sp. JJ-100]
MKYIDRFDEKSDGQYHPKHALLRGITYITVCAALLPTMTGCTLQRDEHTVQFQQMHQPNEQSESLPVWRDVYSESVVHDVYSPQGNTEVLP